jgi:hypothetical protein
MQLTWKASESTSALYAALMLNEGHAAADARLAAAFAPAIEITRSEFEAAKLPVTPFFAQLTSLSASGVEDNRHLVEQACAKIIGRSAPQAAQASRLASTVGGLRAAFLSAYRAAASSFPDSPPLVDELLLRGRPIMEQWEARGPGLLAQIRRNCEENLLVENATITLVHPILGGHGLAHRAFNTITYEAVLTNPDDSLPETLRIAWLLAQLNLDLPIYAENLAAERRELVGQLALLPPVLAAAEHVELAPLHAASLERAITLWRIEAAGDPAETAATLLTWWDTLQQAATPWPVALAALDQMLAPAAPH